jgi:hypothetical protein
MTLTTTGVQGAEPGGEGDLAIISGSNPTVTYYLLIHQDGSATGSVSGIMFHQVRRLNFPVGTFDTRKLSSLLKEIGDVSGIPTETTEISYAGKKSGNLQAICKQASGESKDLSQYVLTTLSRLKIG